LTSRVRKLGSVLSSGPSVPGWAYQSHTPQLLLPHATIRVNHKSTLSTNQRFYTVLSVSGTSDTEAGLRPLWLRKWLTRNPHSIQTLASSPAEFTKRILACWRRVRQLGGTFERNISVSTTHLHQLLTHFSCC
jgi:hypothetical protein